MDIGLEGRDVSWVRSPNGFVSHVPPSPHCPPVLHGQNALGLGPVFVSGTHSWGRAALPRDTFLSSWT